MYKWSRQQLLELQTNKSNRVTVENLVQPPPDRSMFLLHNQNLSFPQQQSLSILTLQAKLDALKRQNQDAISKLMARRQFDDVISLASTRSQDVASYRPTFGIFTSTTGLVHQAEFNPLLTLNASTLRKPCQSGMIPSLFLKSDLCKKLQQTSKQDVEAQKVSQQAVLDAEQSDPKPKRPLSAYNIFFQEQRKMMLDNPSTNGKGSVKADDDILKLSSNDSSTGTTATVSTIHSDEDESNPKKRKRYEPHHKISFECMAKTIAKRWKETVADEDKMRPYQEKAKVMKERYLMDLAPWKQRRRQRLHHE